MQPVRRPSCKRLCSVLDALTLPLVPCFTPWQEYNGCSPRRIRASIVVNFQREGDTTQAQFDKLRKLFKQVGCCGLGPWRVARGRAGPEEGGA